VNPLYEASWLWRRVVTIGILIAVHLIVAGAVYSVSDPDALKWVCLGLIAEAVVAYSAYIMGATVSEWAKIAAAIPGLKITPFGARQAALAETPPPEKGPPSP